MNKIESVAQVKKGQIWNFKRFDLYIINQHGNTAKIESITAGNNDLSRLVTFTTENGEQLCWEESLLRDYATLSEN